MEKVCKKKEFPIGENWAYKSLVTQLSGQTLSTFMKDNVFVIYKLNETGWRTEYHERLIYNYYEDKDTWVGPINSNAGDQSNLFISKRDLAMWGIFTLEKVV